MLEGLQNTKIENKQLIALAAVLFLAPAIHSTLEANNINLSNEDSIFVENYIQYGWYLLFILGGSAGIWLLGKYVFANKIFLDISQIIAGITIILVLLGIYAIFRKKEIIVNKKISRDNIISLTKRGK